MKKPLLLALLCISLFGLNCKKEKGAAPEVVPPPAVNEPIMQLAKFENTKTINDASIVSAETDISKGIIVISDQKILATIIAETILVNEGSNGFLVEVVEKNGSILKVKSASLDQLFKSGTLNFSSSDQALPSFMNAPVSGQGGINPLMNNGNVISSNATATIGSETFQFILDKEVLNEGGLKIDVGGSLQFNPKITGNINFSILGNHTVDFSMDNSPLNFTGTFKIFTTFPQEQLNITKEVVIGELERSQLIYGVWIKFKTKLIDRITISGKADMEETILFSSENLITAKLNYDSKWSSSFNIANVKNEVKINAKAKASIQIHHEIIPYFSIEFYNSVGFHANPIAYNTFNYNAFVDTEKGMLLWHHTVEKGVDLEIGVTSRIFKTIVFASKKFELMSRTLFYEVPKKVEIVAGDNQTGIFDKELEKDLEVKVLDSEGNPLAGVMVFFTLNEGKGKINLSSVITNSSGVAVTKYVVGNEKIFKIKAEIKDAEQKSLSAVIFSGTTAGDDLMGTWEAYEVHDSRRNVYKNNVFVESPHGSCPGVSYKERVTYDNFLLSLNEDLIFNLIEDYTFTYNDINNCVAKLVTNVYHNEDIGTYTYNKTTKVLTFTKGALYFYLRVVSVSATELIIQQNEDDSPFDDYFPFKNGLFTEESTLVKFKRKIN